ncbi:GntR family transcriptional regulator [Christensenellaceae bacterium OttesenSCG-928-M15]|nr:GntR family transcriptional regulator [Christensenellaceae bacterium OttesenSCG-928-M15]
MLQVDKFSRIPIYEQIVAQLERQISLGVFAPEAPLPTVRSLSMSLGVNPNTLQKAYTELERRGMCVSVPGSGRYVAKNARALLLLRSREKKEEFKSTAIELMEAGMGKEELHAAVDEAYEQKLSGGNA